jgi:hypothetical protein
MKLNILSTIIYWMSLYQVLLRWVLFIASGIILSIVLCSLLQWRSIWMCRNAESCLWWVSLCWVSHYAHCCNEAQYAECHIILNVTIPSAVTLSVVYSKWHYTEYCLMLIVAMKVNMLSAILYWMPLYLGMLHWVQFIASVIILSIPLCSMFQ